MEFSKGEGDTSDIKLVWDIVMPEGPDRNMVSASTY